MLMNMLRSSYTYCFRMILNGSGFWEPMDKKDSYLQDLYTHWMPYSDNVGILICIEINWFYLSFLQKPWLLLRMYQWPLLLPSAVVVVPDLPASLQEISQLLVAQVELYPNLKACQPHLFKGCQSSQAPRKAFHPVRQATLVICDTVALNLSCYMTIR